jgi:hypothetical protein
MNYAEAVKMVRGKTNRDTRKVGNNTYAEILPNKSVGIKLHNTYVVKIDTDNDYTLSTGGWYTSTTKDRINSYCPFKVFQKNHDWWVRINNQNVPFYSGMVISSDGEVLSTGGILT